MQLNFIKSGVNWPDHNRIVQVSDIWPKPSSWCPKRPQHFYIATLEKYGHDFLDMQHYILQEMIHQRHFHVFIRGDVLRVKANLTLALIYHGSSEHVAHV